MGKNTVVLVNKADYSIQSNKQLLYLQKQTELN